MAKGIARYYDASKNPGGQAHFSGVPLGDITEEWWAGLPEHLQASVDASDLYRKTPLSADTPQPPAPAARKRKSRAKSSTGVKAAVATTPALEPAEGETETKAEGTPVQDESDTSSEGGK